MGITLIKGGKDADSTAYSYVSGCVTDTRLMGVLGLHLHWVENVPGLEEPEHVHQYLYYDIEEIGLDSISIRDFDDESSAILAEKSSFGGLGAKMVPVSEKEGRYLVCLFVEETKRKKQPLPPETAALAFILDHPIELSEEEKKVLDGKICAPILTDHGAVNYYLMRVFGKDEEGAALLKKEGAPEENFEDISRPHHATFLKNSITDFRGEDGKVSYLSESLTESRNSYEITVSELVVEDGKVVSAKKKSSISVSTQEASLLLNTDEYVSVFEIESDMDFFDMAFEGFSVGTTRTRHDTGEMYMEFRTDNKHVEKSEFRLSDDVFAIYYSTDFGQLIMGTYTPFDSAIAEAKLMTFFKKDLRCTGRYHFAQSVIYEFALSGFDDFEAFISSIE
jgi:hypothetical protein